VGRGAARALIEQIERPVRAAAKLAQHRDRPIRALAQQRELGAAIGAGLRVRQIDDGSDVASLDRRVGESKSLPTCPIAMVASRLTLLFIHALLDHAPLAVDRREKAVQVQVVAILDRGAVDLRDQPARAHQRVRIDPGALPHLNELRRRAARVSAFAAQTNRPSSVRTGARPRFNAPMTLVVMPEECQSIPMTAPNAGTKTGRQAMKQFVTAIVMHDRLNDHPASAAMRTDSQAAPGRHGAEDWRFRSVGSSNHRFHVTPPEGFSVLAIGTVPLRAQGRRASGWYDAFSYSMRSAANLCELNFWQHQITED